MFDRINKGLWWDFGWQLVEGCDPVSDGCLNCWSLVKEKRFRKEVGVRFMHERLTRKFRKEPAVIAIWNDLFHEDILFSDIVEVLFKIKKFPQHIFIILTKRPQRMHEFFIEWAPNPFMEPLPNVWLGVTAENQEHADKRIPILLQIPAAIKFVSCEPLLGKINLIRYFCDGADGTPEEMERFNDHLNWVIAGPETGPKARPMNKNWMQLLYGQCQIFGTQFFDKKNVLGENCNELPIAKS